MTTETDDSIDKLVRIALLAAITYFVLQLILPFLGILSWGFILAVAFYPTFTWLNHALGNRRILAATFLTLFNILILVGVLGLLTNNMIETLANITEKIRSDEQLLLIPSTTVEKWPIIGGYLYQTWISLSSNIHELFKYSNYFISAGSYLIKKMAMQGFDLILFIFAIIFSGYLMTQANSYSNFAIKVSKRIAPNHGTNLIEIINKTIQRVSRGIIGIALLQAMLLGIVLLVADVPGAGLLSFLGLILCIVQLGLFILVLPVMVWLFFAKSITFASIISVLLILVTLLDGFLKPFVLSRGLHTPMSIIFIGVIGGVLGYGLLGVFIGPVILAVFYDLMIHWSQHKH